MWPYASCKENLMKHINEKHKKTETNNPEAILSNLSFHCDQCNFTGDSDKGLKQHTRMKHRISQVDGKDSESDDCSELIERNCLNVLARIVQCLASCNKLFTCIFIIYIYYFKPMQPKALFKSD